jgi:uroporphyrinogen-III synthase
MTSHTSAPDPLPTSPQPLSGKRILITRAHHQAAEMARELEALGAQVVSIPTIEIRPPQSFQPLDKALKKLPAYDWLILTSVNGVSALKKRIEKVDMHIGMLRHLHIAAIGPATRDAAQALGLKVALMPAEYIAESVVDALKDRVAGKRILLVRAKVARDVIPQELRRYGAEVDVAEAYETVVPTNSAEKLRALLADESSRPHVITFTSSSTAANFVTLLGTGVSPKQTVLGIALASIGPVTTATLRESGLSADIEAVNYTVSGLVDAIATHFEQDAAGAE